MKKKSFLDLKIAKLLAVTLLIPSLAEARLHSGNENPVGVVQDQFKMGEAHAFALTDNDGKVLCGYVPSGQEFFNESVPECDQDAIDRVALFSTIYDLQSSSNRVADGGATFVAGLAATCAVSAVVGGAAGALVGSMDGSAVNGAVGGGLGGLGLGVFSMANLVDASAEAGGIFTIVTKGALGLGAAALVVSGISCGALGGIVGYAISK